MTSNIINRSRLFARAAVLASLALLIAACAQNQQAASYDRDEGRILSDPVDSQFQQGADAKPTAMTLYSLARIFAAQGKDYECEYVLVRILREHPKFAPAYNELAQLRLRQGRHRDAIAILHTGLKISPNDPVLLNNLGMCHLLLGEYDAGLDAFTRAAAAAPQNTRYRANMATALGLLGRDQEAAELLSQVLPPQEVQRNLQILAQARAKAATPAQAAATP